MGSEAMRPESSSLDAAPYKNSQLSGIGDILQSFLQWRIFVTLGWQEIRSSYLRTLIGPFWITLNKAVNVASIGLIFGLIFGVNRYIPNLAVGLIGWGLISSILNSSCNVFTGNSGLIKQVHLPLHIHLLQLYWKNLIVYLHTLLIVPVIWLIYDIQPGFGMLWFILGTVIMLLNLGWIGIVLGVACTRFRDLSQIVQNLVQVLYFMTPIMWMPEMLLGRLAPWIIDWKVLSDGWLPWSASEWTFLDLNLFYHLLELVRGPLLKSEIHWDHFFIALLVTIPGWISAIWIFQRHRQRLVYWL